MCTNYQSYDPLSLCFRIVGVDGRPGMRGPPRLASPLNLQCSSLDSALKAPSLLPFLFVLLIPITKTQMTIDNVTHFTNLTNEEYSEPIVSEYELVNKSSSKEYQTLLDRFRRKNDSDINDEGNDKLEDNINTEPIKLSLINETLKYEIEDESNETEFEFTELRNSMEKLTLDDVTRTKLFNDFFTTVNKNVEVKQPTIETTIFVDDEFGLDVNGSDYFYENETDTSRSTIRRRFSNESLAISSPSRVPSIRRALQTPRPALIEGKF